MIKLLQLNVTVYGQNCRIIYNDESHDALVVDPGGNCEQIEQLLEEHKLKLNAILLTHGHLDHIGAVSQLVEKTHAEVIGPGIEDRALIEAISSQAAMLSLPYAESFEFKPVYDGDILTPIPSLKFKVLKTPGHTPGGVCYYCEDFAFVLTGDTLFCGSVGRTDFPGGSYEALIDSIYQKLLDLPDDTRVLSGHGEDSTIGYERRANPFLGQA